MDDELEKKKPSVQADDQSIAIGEIHIGGNITGNITIGSPAEPATDARLRHDLGILLKNVETTWIKGVLEKSVHEAALLELGLELREEAVDNPWRMVMEAPDQTRETLPRGRRIKDIFDEANRLLLILGEPGSGKTTTLLQLARDLIAEVDSAFTQPVPVILNLSTWTNKQQPLEEWLVAELNSKYRLPKKDGQRWLKERRVLPLLDGLDEVRAENRAACVEKINQLVTDYGLQGMVVCSRIKDYTALNVRLAFYRAIYLQPLTPEQVDEYLERAGEKLASLRTTLQNDEALRSMAQSPLILNIMSLAYQNSSTEDLSDPALATNKARRQHLFDTYAVRMFSRKVGARQYEDEQTKQRLSWLARNMQQHKHEVFLIESLQPSWLPARGWQWVYIFASRLISGLSFGLGLELIIVLLIGRIVGVNLTVPALLVGVLSIGLIIGLPIGFIDMLRFVWISKHKTMNKSPNFWWSFTNSVAVSLIVGLIVGLYSALIRGLNVDMTIASASFSGLVSGSIFGSRGTRQSPESDIQTVEALHWSWLKALKSGLIWGLLSGLMGGLLGGLIWGLIDALFNGLQTVLIGGLVGASFGGLSREIIETKSVPNQGIRLSMRNAVFGGLIIGLATAVSVAPILGLSSKMIPVLALKILDALTLGLFAGAIVALGGALSYGGLDVIQHYTLRLMLVLQGHTPANYTRFLDYAVDRIFLQKVGGGYRFIHRLLLEHFAEMGEVKKG